MKRTRILPILAVGAVALISLCGAARDTFLTPEQKLRMAAAIIENYYVEDYDADSLVDAAISAMLETLDPHSQYTDAAETRELTQPLEGKFYGIGIQFNMVDDTVYVVQTTPGGPCEKVGVRPGDRIISANDTIIAGKKMTNSAIIKVLRGAKGSRVTLGVKRQGISELLEFHVVRAEIPMYSMDASYMVTDDIGYISVSRFAETTAEEVANAVDSLSTLGMRHLIIDLGNNGGGYLAAAVDMASEFLSVGDPVVFTKGERVRPQYYSVEQSGTNKVDRIVVMVDQYSASASEIFSGAMQDNDRGVIVGRRTFGKGLVQRPFPFPDGSMIRLTTSRYFTPTGRCIQKPYTKGHGEEYELDMLNRYESGELWHRDSIKVDKNEIYYTLRNHRPVYGGGGIIPDYFVPSDTSMYSKYYRDLIAKGVIIKYSVNYIDANRKDLLRQYKTEQAFAEQFVPTDEMVSDLIAIGEEQGVAFNEADWARSKDIILAILRGYLTRDLFKDGIYVRCTNPLNKDFNEALRIISDPNLYYKLLGEKTDHDI